MSSVALLVLLWGVCAVNAEINSLTYVYTAFTRPVNLPGIHEFSAMGLLDGRPIDYFDSTTQVKVPREPWMKERLEQDYWDKGTSSRKTKQQWFKVNLNILTTRLMKNNTDNHVLQWRHGCNINTDGGKRTVTGTDQYSYDGDDFLSFDSDNKQWVAPMSEAVQTKRKWDGIQQLNDYTEGYLHNECVQWLETFLKYRKEAAQKALPPEVYVYAKPVKNNLKLTCMATGFYPKEISVYIRRDGHRVEDLDGLQSTGVRPNGDGTHQIKMWVMIPKSDTANYTCEVKHPATNVHVIRVWVGSCLDHQVESEKSNIGLVAGVVGVLLVLLVAISTGVAIFTIRKRRAMENSSSKAPHSVRFHITDQLNSRRRALEFALRGAGGHTTRTREFPSSLCVPTPGLAVCGRAEGGRLRINSSGDATRLPRLARCRSAARCPEGQPSERASHLEPGLGYWAPSPGGSFRCTPRKREVVVEDSDQEMEMEEEEEEVVGEEEELGGGEVSEPYLDSAEGGFECKYCSFRTSEVKQFTVHVDQHHPQVVLNASYVCLDCDFHTKRYDALLEHNARQHPGEEGFRRTMLRRHNHTVFQQSGGHLAGGHLAGGLKAEGACRGSIALSKTPIMRAHRRRQTPKKFPPPRLADDVIKLESDEEEEEVEEEEEEEEEEDRENMEPPRLSPAPPPPPAPPRLVTATPLQLQHGLGGVLQIKAGCGSGGAMLPPGTLAQVLSALQGQQGGAGAAGHSQLLIPLSSIPTYNTSMDNNVLLLSAYNRFPYPSVCEIMGLSSQTRFSEEQIKVWFSAQRLKHGVSWTPEEVEEARRKKFNGTVQQSVPQTITVIPAASNGLQSLFQTCQIVGQSGLVLTQSPITLAVAQQPGEPPAEPKRQASPPGAAGADPLGAKPKKSKEQLAELKASYGRRQFATEAEIARLMRVTGLTKRAIKKWFSDTRYNQRNAKEHQGAGGAPGEAPPLHVPPGESASAPDEGGVSADGGVSAVTIVIDSSDDASDGSPPAGPAPSDPRVKFRSAFPDFTPQRFKEKTAEQRLALEASFLTSRTPSDEELSRLRAHTKLTRREVDAWFTERRKASESDAAPEVTSPGAAPSSSSSSSSVPERQATPPAARKVLKKTPEQLHILKTAFVRSQWPTTEEYDAMATESGLPRSYIVNWFGDTRYAWKNGSLKWFYLYQDGKEGLNGGPVKTQKKSRKRFRGWSRRPRRPYPCRRSPQPGPPPVKVGEAVLRDHYLSYSSLQEQQLDELVSRSALSYQQVRDWFTETQRRVQEGLPPFTSPQQEAHRDTRGHEEEEAPREEGEEATDEEEGKGEEEEEDMELEAQGEEEEEEEEEGRGEKEAQVEEKEAQRGEEQVEEEEQQRGEEQVEEEEQQRGEEQVEEEEEQVEEEEEQRGEEQVEEEEEQQGEEQVEEEEAERGEEQVKDEEEQDAVEPRANEKGAAEPIEEEMVVGDSEAVSQSQPPLKQEET
ncbi:unnamed protein product [Lota lota]